MVMRRRRAWSDTLIQGTTLPHAATLKFDLLAGLSPTETKTVSRILINLTMTPPVTNAAADRSNNVFVGIGVVSKEAYDLETLPDTNATADYPQNGWVYIANKVVWKAAPSAAQLHIHVAEFVADVRGQRKVDRGVLFMSLLNIAVNGGGQR